MWERPQKGHGSWAKVGPLHLASADCAAQLAATASLDSAHAIGMAPQCEVPLLLITAVTW